MTQEQPKMLPCPICGNMPEKGAYFHWQKKSGDSDEFQQYMRYKVFCTRCELHACPHWRDMDSEIRVWNELVRRLNEWKGVNIE